MVKEVDVIKMKLRGQWMDTQIWRFCLIFFKCTPPLVKPLKHNNQEGEMVSVFEQITVEMRDKGAVHFSFGAINAHELTMETWGNGISSPV